MTLNDGFDRTVSDWLDEQAGRGAPAYLDEVFARTTRTRQRPAWSSLERWLPVQATLRLAPVPRVAWLLVVFALLVALGVAVLAVGSRPHPAPPFGLARNGVVLYGASDGDIHSTDPVTGESKALVTGPEKDFGPVFSRDGSRLQFGRETGVADQAVLMVANADGSGVRSLTESLVNLSWSDRSPDGSRMVVASDLQSGPALRIYDVDGTAAPQVLDIGMQAAWVAFRPDGRQLVFLGLKSGTYALYAVGADGAGLRPILPATSIDTDWMQTALSPDGTKIAYTRWVVDRPFIHVVDVDTGVDQVLAFAGADAGTSYGWASWSPDGKQLVFTKLAAPSNHLVVGPSTGGAVVETGPAFQDFTNGAVAEFSPDGSKVIARYGFDSSTWILGVTGGPGQKLFSIPDSDLASWQRRAP